MAIHKLFFGGQRTNNPYLAMLPSVAPCPDDVMETDSRKGPVLFSNTRWLPFGLADDIGGCTSCGSADCGESKAINQYLQCNPLAQGDFIDTHIIPRFTEVRSIWWYVDRPVAGVTLDLEFRDSTDDDGTMKGCHGCGQTGTPSTAIAIPGGTIDGSVADSGIIHLPLDGSFYFKKNGLLRMRLTAIPATPPAAPNCQNCNDNPLQGFSIMLSPEIYEPCRGLY